MAKRPSLLSPSAKAAIARELGVADIVERAGWGAVPSRECGKVVRVALEHAEQLLAMRAGGSATPTPWSR